MKKYTKLMAFGLAFAIATNGVNITAQMKSPQVQKTQSWWQKHKRKLIGIGAAAIGLIAAGGLTYHGYKTIKAIEEAGITSNDEEYESALLVVGLLGPIGPKAAANVIAKAVGAGIFTPLEIGMFMKSKIATALNNYYGKPGLIQTALFDKGFSKVFDEAKKVVRDVTDNFGNKLKQFLK